MSDSFDNRSKNSTRVILALVLALVLLLVGLLPGAAAAETGLTQDRVSASSTHGSAAKSSGSAGLNVEQLRVLTPDPIEKYARFEVSFKIGNSVATNVYLPYESATPPGVASGTGITVDQWLLPPGAQSWRDARILPCFSYQPVEEAGAGAKAGLLPVGEPEWRCRFTPEIAGTWRYAIRIRDASGTAESPVQQFECVDSDRKGFVRVSPADPRFFEFSDGTPFVAPLINVEAGNPFNGLEKLRANIQKLGENGARFVR